MEPLIDFNNCLDVTQFTVLAMDTPVIGRGVGIVFTASPRQSPRTRSLRPIHLSEEMARGLLQKLAAALDSLPKPGDLTTLQ